MVRETNPTLIVNPAAYTAVDKAESEPELAAALNATAPAVLAEEAARLGIPLVHFSTDYVFAGQATAPYRETDATAPQSVYGRTKLAGEQAVRAAHGPHAILRTSWVVSSHGKNFVKTMLRLGAERDRLTIVADQVGGPTPAAAIADACLSIAAQLAADPAKSGTYHFSGAPDVSWADFAREIFAQSDLAPEVVDIPSSDYPTPAKRPLNSRLDCAAITRDFGIARPDWRVSLQDVIKELRA